jgi:CDP-4-dehydro-6-deoxyglucose reductase
MARLKFQGNRYAVDGYDTVLNTLKKNGHEVSYGCMGGHCHECLMKATAGQPMPFSQMGLDQALIDDGYFLACRCMIYDDLDVSVPDEEELSRISTP